MKKEKAITWKDAQITKPSSEEGETVHSVLMCHVYNGCPYGDIEWYYKIGSFLDGKFYDEEGKEYFAHYWALINEPHAWECDPPFDVLAGLNHRSENGRMSSADNDRKAATIDDAISIAADAHKGQKDKAGNPYIFHPLRMMLKMKDDQSRMTAMLHDVLEDSIWTFEALRDQGFSEEIIEALDGVTDRKDQGESYEEFVMRAARNPISLEVKIADLEDNMNMFRLEEIRPKDLERLAKYHRSWKWLKERKDGSSKLEEGMEYGNAK